jgi:hypothetical protein
MGTMNTNPNPTELTYAERLSVWGIINETPYPSEERVRLVRATRVEAFQDGYTPAQVAEAVATVRAAIASNMERD